MNDAEWRKLECRDEEMEDANTSDLVARDEDMDDVEGSKRGTVREPYVRTSTSALSHAMLAAGAMSAADSYGAVLIVATGTTPRSVSASGIAMSTARVLTEVHALGMLDFITGFRATPLRPVH